MGSIESAENLLSNLADKLNQMREFKSDMTAASWGCEEGVVISGNDAEMFFGLLAEWIAETKELISGPISAEEVTDKNAARIQTRMKYRFVLAPGSNQVLCIPKDEYDALVDLRSSMLLASKTLEDKMEAKKQFYLSCEDYPIILHLDNI